MDPLLIASAQFENASGDKRANLETIRSITRQASAAGAKVIAFHECSISGYTFARRLSREELLDLAEPIPEGDSVQRLIAVAREFDVAILAGLFERDADGRLFKAQVCVDGSGLIAKHRKLHPFINPNLLPGDRYTVFDLYGWKCGILICYDNNILENVRATAL